MNTKSRSPAKTARPKNPLTQEGAQDRMEAMIEDGMTDEDMARAFGVKVRTLRWWKDKWGLRRPRVMTQPGVRERLEAMREAGKDNVQMAEAFGVSVNTINVWMRRWDLNEPVDRLALSCQDLADLLDEGATDLEIAQALAVSHSTIRRLRERCGLVSPHQIKDPGTRERLEKLLEQGRSYAECSEILGVSESTIYNWARRWGIQPRAGRSA